MTTDTPKPTTSGSWKSAQDLATELNVSKKTIWNWAKIGRISKPTRLSPRCSRWNWNEVQKELGL